jgi:23S rRNA (uracil1939-C5)-methyltransferase
VDRRPARPKPAPTAPRDRSNETPNCRHFGTCGGCSLLDQPIAWQLQDKIAAAERLLAPHLGGKRIAFETPEHAPRHFRTRLLYPVRAERDGMPIVGIYEFRSHHVVKIDECRTQDVWLTELGKAMGAVLRKLRLDPYVPGRKTGYVKGIQARLAGGSGEVVAGIITRPGTFPQAQEFATAVTEAAKAIPQGRWPRQLVGVVHGISERDDEFLLGDRHMPLRGRDHVVDNRDGMSWKISAGSFYQVHTAAHTLLYRPAIAMCGLVRGQRVVDGYGGVGGFGLRLARAGALEVTIVEENESSCRDAEHNAKANELPNVKVVAQPFAHAKFAAKPDLLVVDPPRSGLGEAGVARVLKAAPTRLLYVSCEAESLARDLGPLLHNGYQLTAARLCDLFPHTEHTELVVMLDRKV